MDAEPASDPAVVDRGCPWCGSAEALRIASDGIGGVSVVCDACGCRGPAAPITDSFDDADRIAVARWRQRRLPPNPIAADVLDRVQRMINLTTATGGTLGDESYVSVCYGDLRALLQSHI